jgi:hypothetical protein
VGALVVAAPKELIGSYTAAVKAADLRLSAIETMPLAILRVLTNGQLSGQMHEPAMLVTIEEAGGTAAVVRDEAIQFMHSIESGSDGLSGDPNALEGLADELRLSLSYYQTTSPQGGIDTGFDTASPTQPEGKIEEIILFIDRADSDYICEGLKGYLGVPVVGARHASPLETTDEHVREQTVNYGLSAYTAIGAAARVGAGNNAKSIDLLRPQKLKTAALRNKVSILLLCVFSMLLLSICANLLLRAKANCVMQQVISAARVPAYAGTGGNDTRLDGHSENMEADVVLLETQVDMTRAITSSAKYVDWTKLLREISAIIPKTMWLTDFSWEEGDNATFNGVALSYDSVFKFRDALTDSPYFDSVRLISAQNTDEMKSRPPVEFEILCGIRGRREF